MVRSSFGGSGGVGSVTWGTLRDRGAVHKLRLMTMEAEPRAIELTGLDVHLAMHCFGTCGVITEVELPLDEIIEDLRDELPEEIRDFVTPGSFEEATLFTLVHDILPARVAAYAGAGECEIGSRSLF